MRCLNDFVFFGYHEKFKHFTNAFILDNLSIIELSTHEPNTSIRIIL